MLQNNYWTKITLEYKVPFLREIVNWYCSPYLSSQMWTLNLMELEVTYYRVATKNAIIIRIIIHLGEQKYGGKTITNSHFQIQYITGPNTQIISIVELTLKHYSSYNQQNLKDYLFSLSSVLDKSWLNVK